MHRIELNNITLRFGEKLIFKDFSTKFNQSNIYAITGANGSGKSTLLQLISRYLNAEKGSINHYKNDTLLTAQQVALSQNYVAPYIELFSNLSLQEAVNFHFKHKSYFKIQDSDQLIEILDLKAHTHKRLQHFSSGMMQKVKLALALYSKSDFLFLDEPTMNLDLKNKAWFKMHFKQTSEHRLVILASNEQEEIALSDQQVKL